MNGTVFDIKEFTVHDGPGMRVTVFLKGCPLRCKWCHNPEGLSVNPQIMVRESSCTHCNACKKTCNHPECAAFGRCLHACPLGLISLKGEITSADTLAKKVLSFSDFLKEGGVTFSGGEPLMQHEFLAEVLQKTQSLHKAIETSGYASHEVFSKIAKLCDLVIMDIKFFDRDEHKKYTGVYNDVILENYRWLAQNNINHIVRVPLIPGITDSTDNLTGIAKLTENSEVELLRYNRAAGAKYPMMGMAYPLNDLPDPNNIDIKIFRKAKIL